MAKIAVFDSGLGSLSIIKEIQSVCKSEIIYFADNQNYPYGKKSKSQLNAIINRSIKLLEKKFSPDFIVVASNTPSLILNFTNKKLIDVKPPLKLAVKFSKTKQIGILATQSAIKSKELSYYIKQQKFSKSTKIIKINASELVDLVESGKFVTNKKLCIKLIKKILDEKIIKNSIDVITLSSTHLPFIQHFLEKKYPSIQFLDPGRIIANNIYSKIKNQQNKKNTLKIFTSGNTNEFQTKLKNIGIKNKVNFLSI
ncbi:MAG: aspartate/glutamate racemase family protein [Nitrosopumilus sp.]|uniref:glutamate racemase n=1 Tax=Nitrosopumilus sp. TaxID=2024843 RepID=UPI00247B374E|nr:aspartate/glutamate racemase family protein [Nitrosopumilus sp.]MCV0393244.1 aspartate/glutamate racemase family protein [Nitrosopumilus sp.]